MDDRVYRASELGGCLKSQIALQLGYHPLQPPASVKERFEAGTAAEDIVRIQMELANWILQSPQKEVEIRVTSSVVLRGHVDWIGRKGQNREGEINTELGVVECKSMSDAAFNDWSQMGWDTPGLVQKYKWQLSAYMNACDLPAYLVCYNHLTGDMDISYVPEPFLTTGELKARVLEMDRWVRLGDLPVECDTSNWPCPVAYLHEEAYDPENMEVEDIAVAYALAQTHEKVGKDEKKRLREALDKATEEKSYKSERVTVTYYDRKNPQQIDKDKMKEAGIDVGEFMKEGTSSKSVRVTVHDEGEADAD